MKHRGRYGLTMCLFTCCLAAGLVGGNLADNFEAHASLLKVGSLCGKGEKVVFSCSVKGSSRIVSLCSSIKLTKTEGYLQYRFGLPGKIELEYPKERAGSLKQFEYSHYFRAQVDRTTISFSVNGYSYSIFDNYEGEEKPIVWDEGLTVTSPDSKKDVTYSCRGRAKADFGDLPDVMENKFPI